MAHGKVITKEKFWKMKYMANGGAKTREIMRLECVGEETVRKVRKAANFEEYKHNNRYYHREAKPDQETTVAQEHDVLDKETILLLIAQKFSDISHFITYAVERGDFK